MNLQNIVNLYVLFFYKINCGSCLVTQVSELFGKPYTGLSCLTDTDIEDVMKDTNDTTVVNDQQ